jgi:S-DNA-T family DNA segregation ATPase FtsK/SpoIIIE
LRIGYPRAARLLDQLEEMSIVGPSQGGGREREVLIDPDDELEEE